MTPSMNDTAPTRPGSGSLVGITVRSVVLGLILTIVHTTWLVYEELTLGHIGTPTIFTLVKTVIGILFSMMIANTVLRRIRPSWLFTPPEFMVVFTMTTFGALITSVKLLHYLFPVVMWPSYFPAQSGGEATARSLAWFIAPRDPEVAKRFFVGAQSFWAFFRPEFLRPWLVPMAFWAVFFFILLWTMQCVASIVRRPWLDQERVPFPMIDLPVTMARVGDIGSLFSNRLLAFGFAITSIVLSVNYVSSLYPVVPHVKLSENDIGTPFITNAPWTTVNPLLTVWWPFAIGLCYLIPLDVSFSCWFFFAFIRLLTLVVAMWGWRDAGSVQDTSQFPFFGNAAEGAWLGMFLVVIWNARGFLGQVRTSIIGRQPIPGDESEAIPYRKAILGALVGYTVLVTFGVMLGMRLSVAVVAFALYYIAIIVMARMYAQVAMPLFCMAFFSFTSWTTTFFGTARLSPAESSTLTTFYWFDRTYEQIPMGHHLEAFAFADRLKQSKRAMSQIMLLASVVSIVLGMVVLLQIFYDRGAASARVTSDSSWLAGYAWQRYVEWVNSPRDVEAAPLIRAGISAGVVLLLSYARSQWIGFPLHPIGYLFTASFALEWGMWNVIMVTWLFKWLVVRYGGLRLYRTSVGFFLGMVLGDCVTHFVWGIGLSLAGARGASPY